MTDASIDVCPMATLLDDLAATVEGAVGAAGAHRAGRGRSRAYG
jgi:hypothetical protein